MAGKDNLRKQRTGTVINNTSEKREGKAAMALGKVMLHIINKFGIKLEHESNMYLKNIVIKLKNYFQMLILTITLIHHQCDPVEYCI
jgi:hypothetical protein